MSVLAWKGKRALEIECKDPELAMTNGDIARQLHDFRGEAGSDGKPDRLAKHLRRMSLISERAADVGKFTGIKDNIAINAALVFSRIVPMHFATIAADHGILISSFDELDNL